MFPGFDFTSILGDLQASLTGMINAGIVLVAKLFLLWFVCLILGAFLPRWLRPLVPIAALLVVLAYPAQMNALGDAAVNALFRAGLLPQVQVPDLAGALTSQVQAPQLPNLEALLAQLGL